MRISMLIAFRFLIAFSLLTGLIYPAIITIFSQLVFPWKANGSMIEQKGKIIGSGFIGQFFDSPKYFSGRPSATVPYPYNATNSSGSNFGPLNTDFLSLVKDRVNRVKKINPNNTSLIPVDLVTASGSGLDPDISPLAAFYQVPRIVKARHLSERDLQSLIMSIKHLRTLGVLGEPRINVLKLNLALDNLRSDDARKASKS